MPGKSNSIFRPGVTFTEIKKLYLEQAVQYCQGNIKLVQRYSKIPRQTLYRMIKRYGLELKKYPNVRRIVWEKHGFAYTRSVQQDQRWIRGYLKWKEGLSNKEIAERLGVKLKTVKFHHTNIYKKAKVHGRPGLFAACIYFEADKNKVEAPGQSLWRGQV